MAWHILPLKVLEGPHLIQRDRIFRQQHHTVLSGVKAKSPGIGANAGGFAIVIQIKRAWLSGVYGIVIIVGIINWLAACLRLLQVVFNKGFDTLSWVLNIVEFI